MADDDIRWMSTGEAARRLGVTVRTLYRLIDESELPARSWLSWKAFHPDEPDEKYQGWAWYRNVQRVRFELERRRTR